MESWSAPAQAATPPTFNVDENSAASTLVGDVDANDGEQGFALPNLIITEIMSNPASGELDWEWIEIYNPTSDDINLGGYVLDDENTNAHAAANIASGTITAGSTAILYSDTLSAADFNLAWGGALNVIAVSGWDGTLQLNNNDDRISIWSSFGDYSSDHTTHANALTTLTYDDTGPWPVPNNAGSIYLTDLSADPSMGSNWALSTLGAIGPTGTTAYQSVMTTTTNSGFDIGSPNVGDTGEGVFYSIVTNVNPDLDGDNAFAIDAITGKLTVNDPDDFDHEANTSFVITVRADDGTSYSDTTVTVNVNDANDAPILADDNPILTTIGEDNFTSEGDSVASIVVNGSITDEDGAVEAVAITAVDDTNGAWEYSTDNGGNWSAVDDGFPLGATHALLLNGKLTGTSTHKLRFVPDTDYNGSASFTFKAWDRSSLAAGSYEDTTAGSTVFSSGADSASIAVDPVNDAPTATGTFVFAGTEEDTTSTAVRVSAVLGDAGIAENDLDGDTLGIAVFDVTANGNWQYSTTGTGGRTAFGVVNPNAAVLLSDVAWVRYQPDGVNGETASFEFRAWDQSVGLPSVNGTPKHGDTTPGGGATPYSTGAATVSLTVSSVNDAPMLNATGGTPTFTEGGVAVGLFSGTSISTIEVGQSVTALTLTVNNVNDGIAEKLGIDGTAVALTHGNTGTTGGGFGYSVSVTGTTAAVTIAKTDTVDNYQTLVDGLTYENTSDNPNTTNRVIRLTSISDSGSNAEVNDNINTTLTPSTSVNVMSVNDAPTGVVTIDNLTPVQGDLLTVSQTLADLDGLSGPISYQWLRDGIAIADATGATHRTVQADVDQTINVVASYTDDGGTTETARSAATAAVVNVNDAPVLQRNNLVLFAGEKVVLTPELLSASDVDSDEDTLQFILSDIVGGQFEFISDSDVAITTFNQAQLASGQVVFIDDGDAIAPSYIVTVSDGGLTVSSAASVELFLDDVSVRENERFTTSAIGSVEAAEIIPVAASKTTTDAAGESDKEQADEDAEESVLPAEEIADDLVDDKLDIFADEINNNYDNKQSGSSVTVDLQGILNTYTAKLQATKTLVEATSVISKVSGQTNLASEIQMVLASSALRNDLDRVREDIGDATAAHRTVVGTSIAASTGLSIGYVAWLIRGGALLSSVLSSLPAWHFIDPLPVLGSMASNQGKSGKGDTEEDTVESMFDEPRAQIADPMYEQNSSSERSVSQPIES